jgi:microcin C transport system substrate-binding protein
MKRWATGRRWGLFGVLLVSLGLASCRGGSSPEKSASAGAATSNNGASLNKNDYPVFPDPDAGADPAVPAELGGKGFKGEGWETSTDFDLIGDGRAVKGGLYRDAILDFPGTLRMAGPEANTYINYAIQGLTYEPLVTLHPATLQYIPVLATHWQISPDKQTFRFRIDPNARFSDGTPVTSDDVVASWKLMVDKTLQSPSSLEAYERFDPPIAESKYIVKVHSKELGWQNFDIFGATLRIFPASILKTMNGAAYLKDYNFKLLPGTGPYMVKPEDVIKGKSVSLRRRNDYWAAKYRANVGQYNFDEIRYVVVRDDNLIFELFKKGELDTYNVNRSKIWAQELDTDRFKQGVLVKKKVFNNYPADLQFMAFNARRPPWDDVRMRKAIALLFDRQTLIEKLFFKEYIPIVSFFPGTIYANPNNPKNEYNPEEALKLLADAGWKDRDAQGRLTKGGKPLQLDLIYDQKSSETYLTVFQEDLRKVGITLNLVLRSPETRWKMEMQRQFDFVSAGWGAGGVFPMPSVEYKSKLADPNDTNNISGFKDKRIDEICDEYDKSFDVKKRTALLQELDGILTSQYHYVLDWYAPAVRLAYWNKFGMPTGTLSNTGEYYGSLGPGIPQLWWIDPDKNAKLSKAMGDPSIKMEIPPVEDHYWEEYTKKAQK